MILIISHKEDYTTDYIINILNNRNIDYLRLNTEDIGSKHNISINYNVNQKSLIDGIDCFQSVWFRRTKLPQNNFSTVQEQEFYNRDFRLFLNSFWQGVKADKWLSHPDNVYKAENKLLQLKTAQSIGFQIPETLISTERDKIINLKERCNDRIILKPLFGGRYYDDEPKLIFTNRVKKEHLQQEGFSLFPILFQEEISKEYELRATIVGDKVFCAKVDSQSNDNTKIDWRRDQLKFTPYELPSAIENKCVKLTKQLGLSFGAIDLVKTNNDYVFLEINPNGQWVWIESDTNLKISDAIIEYLTA